MAGCALLRPHARSTLPTQSLAGHSMHRHHATCMQPSAHRRCASEASQCDTPRRHAVLARAEPDGAASAPADAASSPPSFTLVFEEAGGNTRTLEGVESGEILRDVMLDADPPVDLYTTWGKVVSCGGGGQCGTCIVEVLDDGDLLDARNDTELKKLKKKPEAYRLACQLNVGDGENSGTLRFRTKPK